MSEQKQPDVDTFLGPEELYKKPEPNVDQFLGPAQLYSEELRGSYWDNFFKSDTAPGGLMNKFNVGYERGFGKEPLGFDRINVGTKENPKSLTQVLRDAGVFDNPEKSMFPGVQQFNESLLRGTAALADYAMRAAYATGTGMVETASARGLTKFITAPLGALATAGMEAFPAGHVTGFPTIEGSILHPGNLDAMIDLTKSDSVHPTVETSMEGLENSQPQGGGNRIVLDHAPEPPDPKKLLEDQAQTMVDAINAENDPVARQAKQRELSRLRSIIAEVPDPPEVPPSPPPPVSLEIDSLLEQRAELQKWLDGMRQEPVSFDVGGTEIPTDTPLFKGAAAMDTQSTGQRATQAGMADQISKSISEIDKRIADIAPKAEEARAEEKPAISYEFKEPQYADVGLPPEGEVPLPDGVTANPGGGFDVSTKEGLLHAENEEAAVKIAAKYETLTQRRPTIAQEVYRSLVGAGRPDAESRASAALVQAYYEARAARFEGARGTARDLYEQDAASVEAGQPRTKAEANANAAFNVANNTIRLFKSANASTFMHEMAHSWFEQMLRDATHENAPVDLKEDLEAVRSWLGIEGDRPTRAQHEQFARGFERYLMEGVAPEPRLVNVFAKFASWLNKIYKTVTSLKAPITDDIRGVFDRMLAKPRTEAFVEPERAGGPNFADEAERLARDTPIEDSIPVAENIRAERNDIGGILRAEIDAGRQRARINAGLRGAETERGPSGTDVSESGTRGVQSEPAGASIGTGDATVRSSGVGIAEQGQTGSLVDKAGNIRLNNLRAPEDVEQAIRDAARYNNGYGTERRGVISDGDVLELAKDLGVDPSFLDKKAIGDAFNAEEIMASRLLLRQSAGEIRAAMQKIHDGGDPLELAKAFAKAEMIQGKVAQATAEWGRAGRAFRALGELSGEDALVQFLKENKGDFGRTYDQLLQMAKYGEFLNDGQIQNFVRNTHGAKFPILYYYLNSLLSGPITHAVYAIGNELRAIADPLYAGYGAAIGSAREAAARVTGKEISKDRVYWQEVTASMYGFAKGSLEGWRAAKSAFGAGVQVTLPGLRGYPDSFTPTSAQGVGTGFGRIASGLKEGDLKEAGRGIIQAYGLPYRSVAAIHSYGATLRYYQNIFRYATRQALSEDLAGDALRTRVAKLTQNPSEVMMQQAFNDRGDIMPDVPKAVREWAMIAGPASEEAMKQMYMRVYDYHSPAATVIRGLHSNPFTAMLVPFVKVGLEVQRENVVRHTPLGLLSKEVRPQLLGREGGAAFDEAQARLAMGMSLMGGGALLSALGLMDDAGPSEPNERAVWELTHTPHSLQLGPITIPMQGLPVIGSLMMFGADMYGAAALHWNKPEYSQMLKNYLHAFAHAAFDEGFFRDLADIGSMIHEPQRYLGNWLLNIGPNFLPWSIGMGQVNRFGFDPYSKDVHGFDATAVLDSFRRQIPGASQYVPDRVDLFGNPILSRSSWLAHNQAYKNDPVAQMLDRIHMGIAKPERNIEGVELDTTEYNHYATIAGQLTHKMLQNLTTPEFQSLPRGVQMLQVHNVVLEARRLARVQMQMESIAINPRDNLVTKAGLKKLETLK